MKHDADDAGECAGGPVPASLSVHRAFVVQFRESEDSSLWEGRVEHVASGQSATFTSREALLAFLAGQLPLEPVADDPPSAADRAKSR